MLSGNNGLLKRAGDARDETIIGQEKEQVELAYVSAAINKLGDDVTEGELQIELDNSVGNGKTDVSTNSDSTLNVYFTETEHNYNVNNGIVASIKAMPKIVKGEQAPNNSNAYYMDSNGNIAIIPAGFTVSNITGESEINTGLVIKDNNENEFVWIPVGKVYTETRSDDIKLGRYIFEDDGSINEALSVLAPQEHLKISSSASYYLTESLSNNTLKDINGNAIAKNIETFIKSANNNGGYYIGRYEARVENWVGDVKTSNTNNEISWTGYANGKLIEKPNEQIFNYITQNKAAELSRQMYTSEYFESDLINSFAWDTAILFLQKFDNRTYSISDNSNYKASYSRQIRLSGSVLQNRGTNNLADASKQDKICNIFDMADNCYEWTTESYSNSNRPYVARGGFYHTNSGSYTSSRIFHTLDYTLMLAGEEIKNHISFRPILYVK